MNLKQRIKLVLNEALGIPDDIDMIVNIYTNLIIEKIEKAFEEQEPDEVTINVPGFDDEVAYGYEFSIKGEDSWNYMRKSPLFSKEKWEKFPSYKNKIKVNFTVFPDEVFETKNVSSPQVGASHIFQPEKFKIKNIKIGEVYNISSYEFDINISESQIQNLQLALPKLKSVISHEIFHSYQLFIKYKKSGLVGYGKGSVYNSLTQLTKSQFNEEWNKFLMRIYFSLKFEQQARIPQLYYELKDKNINSYDDFMNELKKTEYYNEIKYLKSFSTKEMVNSIIKIESFYDLITQGPKSKEFFENLENWNEFLKVISEKLRNVGMDVKDFRGLSPKVRENPEIFFNYWGKVFNKNADDMFRAAAKIYDKLKKD